MKTSTILVTVRKNKKLYTLEMESYESTTIPPTFNPYFFINDRGALTNVKSLSDFFQNRIYKLIKVINTTTYE